MSSWIQSLKSLKKISQDHITPESFLKGRSQLKNANDAVHLQDTMERMESNRRELEGQAKERQPNMKDVKSEDMGLQIGDNNHFHESTSPAPNPSSGLAKAAIMALAASTGIGVPIGIGMSMIGGDTTNTTVTEPVNNGIRLGKPDVPVQLQSPNS